MVATLRSPDLLDAQLQRSPQQRSQRRAVAYPTRAATSSTLALPVFSRCTARSTRRLWKYDSGDFPSTLCICRASVRLLAPTALAASSSENPRVSRARAQPFEALDERVGVNEMVGQRVRGLRRPASRR